MAVRKEKREIFRMGEEVGKGREDCGGEEVSEKVRLCKGGGGRREKCCYLFSEHYIVYVDINIDYTGYICICLQFEISIFLEIIINFMILGVL